VLDPCPVSGQLHVILLDDDISKADDVYIKHYRVDRTCTDVAVRVEVTPPSHDFGEVLLGDQARTRLELRNAGDDDLMLLTVALDEGSGPDFRLEDLPALPLTLRPGDAEEVTVAFLPTAAGRSSAIVRIETDLPAEAIVEVPVAAEAIGFPAQVRRLIEYFDQVVAAGTLSGAGPGSSGEGRLVALHDMLLTASDYVDAGTIDEACGQLRAVRDRSDGHDLPPDFVAGEAAVGLAEQTEGLRSRMGCPDDGRRRDRETNRFAPDADLRLRTPFVTRDADAVVEPQRRK
jgi:hypothetical protein